MVFITQFWRGLGLRFWFGFGCAGHRTGPGNLHSLPDRFVPANNKKSTENCTSVSFRPRWRPAMGLTVLSVTAILGLFLGMLLLLELGLRLGRRRFAVDQEGSRAGLG